MGRKSLKRLEVQGGTARNSDNPVFRLLHSKKYSALEGNDKNNINNNEKNAGAPKVALAIEGGGMRGSVSAGMVTAISYLGLHDRVSSVYGSSAGSMIGAYFITQQLPWHGPSVYYDCLTMVEGGSGESVGSRSSSSSSNSSGGKGRAKKSRKFIDQSRLIRSAGLRIFDFREYRRGKWGKPVFELDYLLNDVMQDSKNCGKLLNWEELEKMQEVMPLHVIASSLKTERSLSLSYKAGNFWDLGSLARCMKASMLLPGIAGPPVSIDHGSNILYDTTSVRGGGKKSKKSSSILLNSRMHSQERSNLPGEPCIDALLYEPIPYRTPVSDGEENVLVLRTRPDGVNVLKKQGKIERMIMRKYFKNKLKAKRVYDYVKRQRHKRIYAEDVILLNKKNKEVERFEGEASILTVALAKGEKEIGRSEIGREEIFNGVRKGFAAAYDALVFEEEEVGKGWEVACRVFPDEILSSYDCKECGMNWEKWNLNLGKDPFEVWEEVQPE
ncbi:hypothetical protein TL16_g09687 [Triparma laevis f. inornata]|uniref:PNPLA domain-containing protein n=1 Tax=Triparma laevis f. inornata TaxID=1714386 RepID=A0A9W7B473_9STRA|nr:hypothetical protein TL16_g09687 [Triparma laevis f. inornata]